MGTTIHILTTRTIQADRITPADLVTQVDQDCILGLGIRDSIREATIRDIMKE